MANNESFYPFVGNPEDYNINTNTQLPYLKEIAYDFKNNDYIIDPVTGHFKIIEGIEALKVWIYFALKTNRYEHDIFSWDYGTELITLIGQKFTRGLTESESFRYVKEALMVNPYIEEVLNNGVEFNGDVTLIKIVVKSIYGKVDINVRR